jgi:hypothetical protein
MTLPSITLPAHVVRSLNLARPGDGEALAKALCKRLEDHLRLLKYLLVAAEMRVTRQDQLLNLLSDATDQGLAHELQVTFRDVLARMHAQHRSILRDLVELDGASENAVKGLHLA